MNKDFARQQMIEQQVRAWDVLDGVVLAGLKKVQRELFVPEGFEAQIRPRSGLALRHGIVLPNAPGTIDSDYRGEVKVIVMNTGSEPFAIKRGDRIAQLVVAPVVRAEWQEVASLDDTERGAGGFGHSGTGR